MEPSATGKFGTMVALNSQEIIPIPLESLTGIVRKVPENSQLILTAESIGICLAFRSGVGMGQSDPAPGGVLYVVTPP